MILETIKSTGGSLLTTFGAGISDDNPFLGTTTISTGSTISSAVEDNYNNRNDAMYLNATQAYVESMSQDEVQDMLKEIELQELNLVNSEPENNKVYTKTL